MFTSLQRQFLEGRIDLSRYDLTSFMEHELNALKMDNVLPKYYKSLGAPETDYLYMSFLQHHKAPTQLLDFSSDIDIALFFSASDVKYGCNEAKGSLSNYVSLYWIDKKDKRIPSIYDTRLEQCLEEFPEFLKANDKNISADMLDKYLWHFMSWTVLRKMPLGLINGENPTRFTRVFTPEGYLDRLYNEILAAMRLHSDWSKQKVKSTLKFIISKAVVITNLNQVAQKGCFIHYVPEQIETPLEDYYDGAGTLRIHCADIHKSLTPYILQKINSATCNRNSLFPDPYQIASSSYQNTLETV